MGTDAAIVLLAALVVFGTGCAECNPEPGKVRGRISVGSSTASASPKRERLVVATGDALMASPVSRVVRRRLAPLKLPKGAVYVAADTVVVGADAPQMSEVQELLTGGRLDVLAGDDLLVRGESLAGAEATDVALVLRFVRGNKRALVDAMKRKASLAVRIDGEIVSRFEPDDYLGVAGEAGTITITMPGERAKRLAQSLHGVALSQLTQMQKKASP